MKQDYITTNIRIPRSWHKDFKRQAIEEDKSFGELIREMLGRQREERLVINHGKQPISYKDDPIWDLPKLAIDLGDSDLSSRVDEIVYNV